MIEVMCPECLGDRCTICNWKGRITRFEPPFPSTAKHDCGRQPGDCEARCAEPKVAEAPEIQKERCYWGTGCTVKNRQCGACYSFTAGREYERERCLVDYTDLLSEAPPFKSISLLDLCIRFKKRFITND